MRPTDDEEYLHCDITDGRAASQVVVIADEAHVVGDRHGNVEGGEQNQPVPAGFEGAVVKQDELGLFDVCHLVLGQSGRIAKHVLRSEAEKSGWEVVLWAPAWERCLAFAIGTATYKKPDETHLLTFPYALPIQSCSATFCLITAKPPRRWQLKPVVEN